MLLPLQAWMPGAMALIVVTVAGCNMFSLVLLFDDQAPWKILLRSLAGFVLYLLAYLFLMLVVAVVAMAVLGTGA